MITDLNDTVRMSNTTGSILFKLAIDVEKMQDWSCSY